MRIAAVYDVHGNLPALDAVLDEVRRSNVDLVVVGGDVVPGPMPRESLARLRSLDVPVRYLRGNGEAAVLALRSGQDPATLPEQARAAVRWVADAIDDGVETFLAAWPSTVRLAVGGLGDVLFCHATPRSDTEIFTRETSADLLEPILSAPGAPVVVCGHTHMQFDRRVGATRVVNAGSVGMPFGEPGAYWALVGPAEVELRRTLYDLDAAASVLRATAYPAVEQFVQGHVLRPPAEHEMLAALARAELRA